MRKPVSPDTVVRVLDADATPPAEIWRGRLGDFELFNELDSRDIAVIRMTLAEGGKALVGGGASPAYLVEIAPSPSRVTWSEWRSNPRVQGEMLEGARVMAPGFFCLWVERPVRTDVPPILSAVAPWSLEHIRLTTLIVSRIFGPVSPAA